MADIRTVLTVILLAIVALIGLPWLINPRRQWEKKEGWKAGAQVPDKSYFRFRRIFGATLVGIFVIYILMLIYTS